MKVKLLEYLTLSLEISRRKLVEKIQKGLITVNGKITTDFRKLIDPRKDLIRLKGRIIKSSNSGVIIFNKPPKVIVSRHDSLGRRTVYDYLPKKFRHYDPVGRLDYWSTGLLVFTNDGMLAELLSHPRYQVPKVYLVKVTGTLKNKDLRKLLNGLIIDGRKINFKEIQPLETGKKSEADSWYKVTLTSGHNRVIRKAFEKIYYPVQKLKRIEVGPLRLGSLKPGEIRHLSERQYLELKKSLISSSSQRK
ncbi:MAG: pseudouridine synthase [Deltaproteobacteria bacterium]|nr:pseudouridine synthase [Deltaproteobacteria bacterium]